MRSPRSAGRPIHSSDTAACQFLSDLLPRGPRCLGTFSARWYSSGRRPLARNRTNRFSQSRLFAREGRKVEFFSIKHPLDVGGIISAHAAEVSAELALSIPLRASGKRQCAQNRPSVPLFGGPAGGKLTSDHESLHPSTLTSKRREMNRLYFGDNLEWLRNTREFPDGVVDLVYLDPPSTPMPTITSSSARRAAR